MEASMLQFEEYRWEDHVPRKGSWGFNLVLGAAAFALIAAMLHHAPSDTAGRKFVAAKPSASASLALASAERSTPTTPCPVAPTDS
jgi:hypothetical protein